MIIEKNHINFAVGPVQMTDYVLQMGSEPVPYFRTAEFSALMLENERILKKLMDAPAESRAVFLTGSGTAAMDAVVQNVFSQKDRLLIVDGGGFGHRFCEICQVYGIAYTPISVKQGYTVTRDQLDQYSNQGYTGLLINMHETSTGVLYDMDMVGQFCRENDMVLIVDAISAFLADEISMKKLGAAVVLTGSQKALAVPPGVSMMVLSREAVDRVNKNTPACYYLDLKAALRNQERGQTPFTPAVGVLIQLNARLCQIESEGIEAEKTRICAVASDFRKRIRAYPFQIVSQSLSNAVTPLSPTNPEVSAKQIFQVLKDEYGIIVCPNGGEMAERIFRVGHIGNLTIKDNDALFKAFDDLIARGILKK